MAASNNDYRINWKKLSISQEGEGTVVHPLVALALTPIIGLVFLMFLPFIGFYLSAQALIEKAFSLRVHVPAQPAVGAAYLTGQEPSGSTLDEDLASLEAEVNKLRSSSK